MNKKKVSFLRKKIEKSNPIYDDATAIYSLRKFYNWNKAILKIRRSSDDAVKFIFFDGNTITLNSLIGDDYSTKSATTLGSWIGSNSGFVEEWVCQTVDNVVYTSKIALRLIKTEQPKFINSGVIVTKSSFPAIDFLTTTAYLNASAIPALDYGNTFTSFSVSSQNTSSFGAVFSTRNTIGNRLLLINDSSTNRYCLLIESPTLYQAKLLTQLNSSANRLLSNIVKPTLISSYLNNIAQEINKVWSGSYVNNSLTIGVQSSVSNPLNGTIQEIIIFPSDKVSNLSEIHTDINSYYSIY